MFDHQAARVPTPYHQGTVPVHPRRRMATGFLRVSRRLGRIVSTPLLTDARKNLLTNGFVVLVCKPSF